MPRAYAPAATSCASTPTSRPLIRRKRSVSISTHGRAADPRVALELDGHHSGHRPESGQVIELHRPQQHADIRQCRGVLEAERTTGRGDLVNAIACTLRDG